MSYEKIEWEDLPSKKTPMNAENFNHMEQGILENSQAIEETKKELDECLKFVSDGKTAVAAAITGQGVATAADATFDTMASNIKSIQNVSSLPNLTKNATITHASNNSTPVIEGDQIYLSENSDGVKRVEVRYTGEKGIVENNTLFGVAASKLGTATPTEVVSGYSFSSPSGVGVAGTMPNNGAWNKQFTNDDLWYAMENNVDMAQTIPKGYHSGGGKAYITAAHLKKVKDAYYNNGYSAGQAAGGSEKYTVKTGTYSFPNLGATSTSITFPSAFSSAPAGVYTKVLSGTETAYHYADNVTKSGFTLHAGNGAGTTTVIGWVAWGN